MKTLLPGLVLAASLAACDQVGDRSTPGPVHIHGSADPRTGEGMTSSVSRLFERAEVEKLHARLNSRDFQERLTRHSCGDPVPKVDFTLSLWPEGEYMERWPRYHYHDPLTGKELPPETYAREVPQEPRCDCSKADSGEEWVTWPAAQN